MAVSHQPVFVQTPKLGLQTFANADSTNKKTLYTAGSNGSKITAINVASTDTTARIAQLWVTRSAVSYYLTTLTIPIASGTDGTVASANLLTPAIIPSLPIDNDGQPYFFLESGDTLQVSFTVAVTSNKQIDFATVGADF